MLAQEETGLVVVDVQGKLARIVHDSEGFILRLSKLITGCKILSVPIIWLEHNPLGLGPTIPEVADLLTPATPVEKFTFNACHTSSFMEDIENHGRKQWLIAGIEAHVCVYQTAVGMLERSCHVELVTDAVSSRARVDIELARRKLEWYGAASTSMEMCLFELVKDSRREEFKKILELVK